MKDKKPYWLFLDAQEEMKWDLFNYFPAGHYKKALDQALREEAEDDLVPDGGKRTQYYWVGDEVVLYHTEKEEDLVIPFFDTVDDAERFLENQPTGTAKTDTREWSCGRQATRKSRKPSKSSPTRAD